MGNSAEAAIERADGERVTGAQTLLRGLDVIDVVLSGPVTLSNLSEQLGLTRSTTHRLAAALVDRRLLTLRSGEGYSLGPKLLELGHAALRQSPLLTRARPWLEALSRDTADTVHLGVLQDDQALYLDKVEGRRRVNVGSRLGERHPIATTGLGKALILDLDEDDWRLFHGRAQVLENPGDLAIWLERMRSYASKGYAFDLEENEDHIRCVAAPVRDASGRIIAAISVSSAAQYMADARMTELVGVVTIAADAISRDLGWTPKF